MGGSGIGGLVLRGEVVLGGRGHLGGRGIRGDGPRDIMNRVMYVNFACLLLAYYVSGRNRLVVTCVLLHKSRCLLSTRYLQLSPTIYSAITFTCFPNG